MTTYTMTGPDGKDYSIDGPPGATQAEVAAQMHAQFSQAQPQQSQGDKVAPYTVGGMVANAIGAQPQRTPLESLGRQAGLAARYGIEGVGGLAGTLADIPSAGANAVLNAVGADKKWQFPEQNANISAILDRAGFPQPENGTERVVGDVGRAMSGVGGSVALGRSLAQAGSPILRTIGNALQSQRGAQTASAAAGSGTASTAREAGAPVPVQIGLGLAAGALPFAPGISAHSPGLPSMLGDISPETAALYQKMKAQGVDVRPAQTAAPGFIKTADDVLQRIPFTGYGKGALPNDTQQAQQFTRAISHYIGEDTPALTEHVMSRAYTRIGKVFDTVIPKHSISMDPTLASDISSAGQQLTDIAEALPDSDVARVSSVIQKVQKQFANNQSMPGKIYQEMRRRNGLLDTMSSDPNSSISQFGNKLRDSLDDAFIRQAPPADGQALKTARWQYRIAKTIDPLVAKSPTGVISPPSLAGPVRAEFPDMSTGGATGIGDLARGGQAFLKAPPNSGTPERSLVLRAMTHPSALVTGALGTGAIAGGTAGTVAAIPTALAVARFLKNLANSKGAVRQLTGAPVTPPLLIHAPTRNPIGLFGSGYQLAQQQQRQ